jgi:hypothetical protein
MPVEKERGYHGRSNKRIRGGYHAIRYTAENKSWETCHTIESFLYNEAVGP